MRTYSDIRCWEIMNCDNLECPARREPDIPCWEIAEKVEAYHNASNTCNDCVVYIIKDNASRFSMEKVQKILKQRVHLGDTRTDHQVCF